MDPLLGFLGPIAGGLINNLFAGSRQDEAQAFAIQQAATAQANFRLNRQTAYQDTMMDMKKAGLNPILAYQKGSTPGTMGPTPAPVSAPVHDVGVGAGVNSAIAIRRQNQELENMKSTQALTDAQKEKTIAEKRTEDNRPDNVKASTENLVAQTGYTYNQLERGLAEAMQSSSLANWIQENPKLTQALMVAGFAGGKASELVKPFTEAVRGLIAGGSANSAGSMNRGAPIAPPGSSSKSNQNFDNKYGRPIEPAPPHPGRGWFSDRFYGVPQ